MYVTRCRTGGRRRRSCCGKATATGGKVKTRTLANLSRWPEHKVEALDAVLKGLPPAVDLAEAFEITRSLPHGHVAAVLGTAADSAWTS